MNIKKWRTLTFGFLCIYLLGMSMTPGVSLVSGTTTGNDSLIKKTWPQNLKRLFFPLKNKFTMVATNTYDLDSSYRHAIGLKPIDTFLLRKIHDYKHISKTSTWVFDQDLHTTFYYSIDLPVQQYYPVTIVQLYKFGTTKIYLILLKRDGSIFTIQTIGGRDGVGRALLDESIAKPDSTGEKRRSALIYSSVYAQRMNDSTFKITEQVPDRSTISDPWTCKSDYKESELIIYRSGKIERKETATFIR